MSSCGDAAQKRLKTSPRLADRPRARQREVRYVSEHSFANILWHELPAILPHDWSRS
ncbi:hypothetical protein CEV34_1560 [Brucella pseudogrignonensis]|uniref:Uncharacterized protein n=1 Tax=Brucella pseudogrignonensis TaxID=419475 RepID=A0A256GM09_9HYPH|nr:hypothetical protein CEV34_1560 [Brucella pseudogrignonensis]